MLNKTFSHKASAGLPYFPFALTDGSIPINKEKGTPTLMNFVEGQEIPVIDRLMPEMAGEVTFYAVTQLENGQRLVAVSDGHVTQYYWYEGSLKMAHLIHQPSNSHESCWESLFKAMLMDDSDRGNLMFMMLRPFFRQFLQGSKESGFQFTLSGKWKGEFVHLDVEHLPVMGDNLVQITINGQDSFVSLDFHPLKELLG